MLIAIALLGLTNLLTLFWAFKTRVPLKISKQVKALQGVVAAFEIEGQTVLHISKIRPDDVFLRAMDR